ncbi:MAG: glycosyltransferase family 4 protein [Planctomycetota bacterium]
MKVLLLSPAPTELHLGSSATVARLRDGLQRRGHLCEVFGDASEGGLKQSLEGTIARFRPDIVHAHDAARCGVQLLGSRTPWVVSLSGEDLGDDALGGANGPLVCEALRRAHRVLAPSAPMAARTEELVPETVGKVDVVVRSAVPSPTGGTDLRRSLGIPRQRFVAFLPGGIRPVKGQLRAVRAVARLRAAGADVELILAGPEQDADYARAVRAACEGRAGVRLLPRLARERMGAAYLDADVVLNTSAHEGAASAILEAGVLGRPVVASDIPGNRALIRHKETGLLFSDEDQLAKQVLALCRDRGASGTLGVRIREDFARRFGVDRELGALLSAYAAA